MDRALDEIVSERHDLFNRIGPVLKLSLVYDRAGRSEGVAYVTYESPADAKRAIREFDGANAKDVSGPPPSNVDRYVPGRGSRSRSPRPRRDGRRAGARRERGDRRGGARGGSERVAKDGRPKKTQEELDAEMDDYWGAKDNGAETSAAPAASAQDDIDMIE
ncbi:putative mRNA export protein mlo3 [Glarea lozoyensis 74030]|uniref:Putative mRNA export protein mlo3 n=1 Tax=Glarea lozoyensis (strain ATCC 74030 / MF5533) TaxID=1104152 RepID=H0EG11_GLAL7|nr:putative mRNA export protein mlo3 [Glarea lozoyensis 74030]